MALPRRHPPAPPLFRGGGLLRLLTLLVMLAFVLWAMARLGNPRAWRWLTGGGEPVPAPTAPDPAPPATAPTAPLINPFYRDMASRAAYFLGQLGTPLSTPGAYAAGAAGVEALEYVPPETLEAPPAVTTRRAPAPDPRILRGAVDREAFLVDLPGEPPDLRPRYRLDADARYHLIDLAWKTKAADLAADSLRNVRYTALMERPDEYRGQIITIEGRLLWVRTFELKRSALPFDHIYEGVLEVDTTDQSYWILFTDLPPNFPPAKQWTTLYLDNVRFSGYFLKVLRVERPPDSRTKAQYVYAPVLVGHTVELPPPAPPPAWQDVLWTLAPVALGFILVALLALWLYRRSERRYLEKMAEVRRRIEARPPEHLSPDSGPQPDGPIEHNIFVDAPTPPAQQPPTTRNGSSNPDPPS